MQTDYGIDRQHTTHGNTEKKSGLIQTRWIEDALDVSDNPKPQNHSSDINQGNRQKKTGEPLRTPYGFSNRLDNLFIRLSPEHLHAEDFHGTASIKTAVLPTLLNRILF